MNLGTSFVFVSISTEGRQLSASCKAQTVFHFIAGLLKVPTNRGTWHRNCLSVIALPITYLFVAHLTLTEWANRRFEAFKSIACSASMSILQSSKWSDEKMDQSDLKIELGSASKEWTGCHWQTRFGPRMLDLNGLFSRQAILLAEATAGNESSDWLDAAQWLETVEKDARYAMLLAQKAVHAMQNNLWEEAKRLIDCAIELESNYRDPKAWPRLGKMIYEAEPEKTNDMPLS